MFSWNRDCSSYSLFTLGEWLRGAHCIYHTRTLVRHLPSHLLIGCNSHSLCWHYQMHFVGEAQESYLSYKLISSRQMDQPYQSFSSRQLARSFCDCWNSWAKTARSMKLSIFGPANHLFTQTAHLTCYSLSPAFLWAIYVACTIVWLPAITSSFFKGGGVVIGCNMVDHKPS